MRRHPGYRGLRCLPADPPGQPLPPQRCLIPPPPLRKRSVCRDKEEAGTSRGFAVYTLQLHQCGSEPLGLSARVEGWGSTLTELRAVPEGLTAFLQVTSELELGQLPPLLAPRRCRCRGGSSGFWRVRQRQSRPWRCRRPCAGVGRKRRPRSGTLGRTPCGARTGRLFRHLPSPRPGPPQSFSSASLIGVSPARISNVLR
jgi:hypothetical protein